MENVPKIVRERLRVAIVAANHPDAEMLTAFAERSLRGTERASVLEHLARCGECREIVALALPAIEAAEAPVTAAKGNWFAWPVVRWGFAVAGLAVIASLGVAHFQHRRPAMMAYKAAPPAVTQARNEGLPAVASPAPQAEQDKEKKITRSVSGKAAEESGVSQSTPAASPVNAAPAAVGPGLGRAALPRPANQANQIQQQRSNRNKLPVPPPPMTKQEAANQPAAIIPSSAEAVEAQPSSAAANTQSQALDIQNEGIADQSSNYGHGEEKVGRAKEPTDTTVVHMEPEKMLAASARAANSEFVFSAPTARWAITSAGGLQRSLDQGNSWQDVSVKGGPVSPAQSSFQAAPPVSLEKAKDAASAGKKANEPIVFRAVAANGSEVWAGGSAGQLYHSMDAGYHWNKVVPSAAGAVLTGDVVSLEFLDAQHGRVSTSTSEVWVTGDDGLTWQKQ